MSSRRQGLLAVAGLSLLAAAAACRKAPPEEIRIGLLATFTGPYADISGTPTEQGAELAVRDAGPVTIGGVPYAIRLVRRGFDDRPDAAASAARALINQSRVIALVGPQFSRHAIPVSVVAEGSRIPMISPMSSNPAVTAGKRFVFRLAFLDDVQGRVLARFAREDLHAQRAAVLYDISTAYSHDLAERFREAFGGLGGQVVGFEAYTADRAQDFGAALRRIAAARPDVLLLPNFPDAVNRQIPQVQRAGVRATLLGSDSWDPITLPPLGAQPAYVTNQWRNDLPLVPARRFLDAYRAAYGAEPRATAALTYDAVRILIDAMRRAGRLDPDAIRDAIAATHAWTGASGTVSFDGGADPRRAVAVSSITGRTLATARLVEP